MLQVQQVILVELPSAPVSQKDNIKALAKKLAGLQCVFTLLYLEAACASKALY